MEYAITYDGTSEDRQAKIKEQEALGRVMLHDDFMESGWLMTFIDPIPATPPTPEELLLAQFEVDCNSEHTRVLQAIANWGSLTLAQKDQLLKLLAKAYIVFGVRTGCFVL